jgi:hypothetical protein
MATPLTATQMVAALRAEGVTVHEVRSWRTHNRNHKGPWGPVNGVMIHHTVTSGTASSVALCYDGHSTLPGPLCHGVIDKKGEVWLVGNGRANHAGSGDDDVLKAVVNETSLPADDEANTDGNRYFYGFEAINLGDGKDPWPAAQVEGVVRASAAICRAHGWNERSIVGHKEWQPGKVDPRGIAGDMDGLRKRVDERLKHPASWSPGTATPPKPPAPKPTTPAPAPAPREEDGLKLSDQVPLGKWIPELWPDDAGLADGRILVQTALGSTYGHARAAREAVDALRAEVADLRAMVVKLTAALTKES